MEIKYLVTGPISVNTYVVINDDQCIVIDPGGNYHAIMDIVGDRKVSAVLLTHGHFDHIGAADSFSEQGIDIYIHIDDREKLTSQRRLAMRYGIKINEINNIKQLKGGENLNLAGLTIKAIHTPGHSKGSVIYIIGDNIFSGDTLFSKSYGRTDLFDGDFEELKHSIINIIFNLKGEYIVFPGHEEFTTLSYEKENNPILL